MFQGRVRGQNGVVGFYDGCGHLCHLGEVEVNYCSGSLESVLRACICANGGISPFTVTFALMYVNNMYHLCLQYYGFVECANDIYPITDQPPFRFRNIYFESLVTFDCESTYFQGEKTLAIKN